MFTHRRVLQSLSTLIILSIMFSGFSLPVASAQEGDDLQRHRNAHTGKVSFIGPESGRSIPAKKALGAVPSARLADPALAFAKRFGPEFGLQNPARDLTELKANRHNSGRVTVRYQQNYQGIPVMGGELLVNTNENGDLYSVNGEISPDISLSTQPTIDSEQARQTVLEGAATWYEKVAEDFVASTPELWIYDESLLQPSTRPAELVWRMEVTPKDMGMPVRELVLVNAERGDISLHFNQVDTTWSLSGKTDTAAIPEGPWINEERPVTDTVSGEITNPIVLNPQIQTYTANNSTVLPGTFLCDQTQPQCTNGADTHADAAHQYALGTYSLYGTQHLRDSIDNAGMVIISTVRYRSAYANAGWTGSQMVYGDAYGFALADDVIGHELTHGVTQYESDLFYYYQSGAINESFSDLWGEYYDQTNGQGNDNISARWSIGEDISGLGAIRSMSDPPAFSDPDKMSSPYYHTTTIDNGGVHTNSGVNNKAAFLMVDGGIFNNITVMGIGWDKTAAIYYEVNTNLLSSGADYSDLYYALQQACSNLIGQKGITSDDCMEVRNAVDAVEMNAQLAPEFNTDAPYCDPGSSVATVFSDDLEAGIGNWTFDNGAYTRWQLDGYGPYVHSGKHSLYANDRPAAVTDASAQLIPVLIPAGAYLHFFHAYDFQTSTYYYDGGVLEYSTDEGTTWQDAGSLIDYNGYKGTIYSGNNNPLQSRSAFVGASHGYISTRLNLAALAGQTVVFRWRMGLDQSTYRLGWWVDDVKIYRCIEPDTTPPAIASIVRADANPDLTSAASVDFTVTLSEPVTGVDADDFTLNLTGGIIDAAITDVAGSDSTWTVAVNTGYGNGTLGLSTAATVNIIDLAGNSVSNLPFTGSELYVIEKIPAVGVYDDTDLPWNYSTGWAATTASRAYAGTLQRTNTKDATATFKFQGPAFFTLSYRKGPHQGPFEIWVDGRLLKTIHAYSTTTVWQKTYTSPAFTDSDGHTLMIKNISPTGRYVDVDAVEITLAPSPAGPGSYDDVKSPWIYSPKWRVATTSRAYAGTIHRTSTKASTATFVFQGPAFFTLHYCKGPNRGAFIVYVDDVKLKTINAYSGNTTCQKTYTSPAFTDGKSHTVVVKNISPAGRYIDIDAMEVTSAPPPAGPGIYDGVDPLWIYSANWTAATASSAYGGTFQRTNIKDSTATFIFQAPGRFILYYGKGKNRGSFTVYVDGLKLTTINVYSTTLVYQKKYISPTYTDNKPHTIVIRQTSPSGTYIDIDAIQIE